MVNSSLDHNQFGRKHMIGMSFKNIIHFIFSVVKYSDEQVPGSPFIFNVSYPPDASKVRVYGPGIEHGILST